MKNPIFVALDLDDEVSAMKVVEATAEDAGGFKIGPRLLFNSDVGIIKRIAKYAPVFLDFKFYDIPSTMDSAVRSAFEAGSRFVSVHTTAGSEALGLLSKTEKELSQIRPFKIFAVTILTSFSEKSLPPNYKTESIEDQIVSLVEMGVGAGITSFVCSPHELKTLKNKFPQCDFITPGIRLNDSKSDDQKRTMTPKEALQNGAAALVIGRPILAETDPATKLRDIIKSLSEKEP